MGFPDAGSAGGGRGDWAGWVGDGMRGEIGRKRDATSVGEEVEGKRGTENDSDEEGTNVRPDLSSTRVEEVRVSSIGRSKTRSVGSYTARRSRKLPTTPDTHSSHSHVACDERVEGTSRFA